jgi:hypothetical protein
MHRPNAPVSLADLAAAGIRLRPYEAATLVRELVGQVISGKVAGLPSPHVIRLSSAGTVTVEGPVAAGGASVARAAQLLESLLPPGDCGVEYRVPGALKLLLARSLGTLDLPAIVSLQAFADALSRFAAPDPPETIRKLASSWEQVLAAKTAVDVPPAASEPAEPSSPAQVERFVSRPLPVLAAHAPGQLTVSDIRRARRATGLSLDQVSQRSRIPVALLRQLEWGYLANWPGGHYGRTQVVRYARAAGLDEQLVVSTLMPLVAEAESRRTAPASVIASEPVSADVLTPPTVQRPPLDLVIAPVPYAWTRHGEQRRDGRLKRLALAGLAIPAMVALGFIPALWPDSSGAPGTGQNPAPVAQSQSQARQDAASGKGPETAPKVPDASPRASAGSNAADSAGAAADTARPREEPARPREEDESYRLTQAGITYSPSVASAGSAMFYPEQQDGNAALVRAGTDGSGSVLRITRIVDDGASNFHVRPSPDGRRIAFDSDRDGVRGIYLAESDGRNVRRVSPEGFAAVPSWSPDGTTLAFVRAEPERPQVWNLWTLRLETGELRQLTRYRVGQPWGASWFPDGKRIAFGHEFRLIVLDVETGAERVFATPRRAHVVRTPAVSPDGERIVFQVRRDGGWMLELGDGSMRRILEDATAEEFTWAPDGSRFAYHSGKSGTWGVWVMAPRMARASH